MTHISAHACRTCPRFSHSAAAASSGTVSFIGTSTAVTVSGQCITVPAPDGGRHWNRLSSNALVRTVIGPAPWLRFPD
ncbi:hypothetical protein GCM10010339_74040 [Streptomyces alanosinicus]|uniref:Uncharacterized protein n=1 Tax=Streptomyces alanosinicus TaxID=68171 RepID=A0A918YR74_9ACTN|nr:hypothetical protein GCM10010339_74040 [Streptomyces alanosinicus]